MVTILIIEEDKQVLVLTYHVYNERNEKNIEIYFDFWYYNDFILDLIQLNCRNIDKIIVLSFSLKVIFHEPCRNSIRTIP